MGVGWLALIGWAGMAAAMAGLYLIARRTSNAGWVDVGWTVGVGALAGLCAWGADGDAGRRVLLVVLAGGWAARLAVHVAVRTASEPEDGRYRMLREQWGEHAERHFFLFFQVQAAWAVLFAVPFAPAAHHTAPLMQWTDWAAVSVWLVSVAGESLADRQLARFRAREENKGKTCRAGLWRYSRHPNYFFEWLHWFTYLLLAAGSPYVWVALAGPVVMLLFLLRVTGIPYTERRALQTRGDDYRRYQQSTSAFVPWFPKKERPS